MAKQVKLRTKLYAGYGVVLAILLLLSVIVSFNVSNIMTSVGMVNHTYDVIEEIEKIEKAIVNMETGQRGFIIAGKEVFLDPFKDGKKSAKKALDKGRKLTSDNPKQVKRFDKVEALINEWFKKAANVEINARREMNKGNMTFKQVSALIVKATGKDIMDNLRVVLDELHAEENRLMGPRKNDQRNSAQATYYFLIFGTILAILLGLTIGYIIIKGVGKQLGGEPSDVVDISTELAGGNFTVKINQIEGDTTSAIAAMEKMRSGLEGTISDILLSGQNLAQAVGQIAQGNQNLSQRTSEQASSLEEIASTIEETTATVNANADNANNALNVSGESSKLAGEGGTLVNDAVLSINEINATSQKIGEIITVINEISFQTNLLALNAAVEAARAGEQGRGFAVVAGEVRNLAQRSGNAAKEIGDLIKDSINKIEIGTEKANKSGEALKEIIKSVEQVNRVIQEISAASTEQKQGMSQINVAVTEMDSMTQQNASLVEETASASEEMSNQAAELLEMMEQFTIDEAKVNSKKRNKSQNAIHMISTTEPQMQKTEKSNIDSNVKPQEGSSKGGIDNLMADDGFEKF